MALSREAVVWGFRLVLGREPEDEAGIQAHMHLPDETALMETLLRSTEFATSNRFSAVMRLTAPSGPPGTDGWPHESRAKLKVVVFGNCQAASIARLLQAMTGDIVARSFETTPGFHRRLRDGSFDLDASVTQADLVLVQAAGEVNQAIRQRLPRQAAKLRQMPALNYAGFHPDCLYIGRPEGGYVQGPMGEYQSSIIFWAWQQGLHPEQAVELFRPEVFEHLGFGQYHLAARKVLLAHGRSAQLPLAGLLDQWLERGCFMHTVNHPRLHALADVVAASLCREGLQPMAAAAAFVDDSLARWPVWPVYPGLHGAQGGDHYLFKLDRGFCPADKPVLTMDLPTFVEASFGVFQAAPPGLRCERIATDPYQQLTRFVRERPAQPSRLARITGAIADRLSPLVRPAPAKAKAKAAASPYHGLPPHRFWRRSVEQTPATELDPVVRTGFTLDRDTKVATAGSCFAQHIARTLRREKFNYLVADAVKGMDQDEARRRGFGVYSARYGNLYTARQLVQLFDRAHGDFQPLDRAWQREADGHWVDPFRPQIEPDGFRSAAAVEAATQAHLADVRKLFASLDVFVFTLGLTEGWRRREDGAVFPLAPGVAGGRFDAALHEFVNFDTAAVLADLRGFVRRLRGVNEQARVVLTVSPVPLIATYEDQHVLVSTVHSKSVLRTAAGALAAETPGVDYFPSYEIVTGTPSRGSYFEADLRAVTPAGVAHVMRVFLRHYAGIEVPPAVPAPQAEAVADPGPPEPASLVTEAVPSAMLAAIEREQESIDSIVCDEESIDRHLPG